MKKIICALVSVFLFASCDKDEYQTFYQDMIYFVEEYEPSDTPAFIGPATSVNVPQNSTLTLFVMRDLMAADDHPKQTAKIVVDQELSTATEDVDFTLSKKTFEFKNTDTFKLPLTVNIRNAKDKTIVLKLEYGYYDECPLANRKADRLKIKIE